MNSSCWLTWTLYRYSMYVLSGLWKRKEDSWKFVFLFVLAVVNIIERHLVVIFQIAIDCFPLKNAEHSNCMPWVIFHSIPYILNTDALNVCCALKIFNNFIRQLYTITLWERATWSDGCQTFHRVCALNVCVWEQDTRTHSLCTCLFTTQRFLRWIKKISQADSIHCIIMYIWCSMLASHTLGLCM